jgi:putative endonuclease
MDDWWVYLLHCADDSYYCGVTNNLDQRIHDHNNTAKGAAYTRSRRPVNLAWSEKADSQSDALKREAQIKKMTREQKLELIRQAPKIIPATLPSVDSEDKNIILLCNSLSIVKSQKKKPILWKLTPALIKSVCEYSNQTYQQVTTGKFLEIDVDLTSSNPGLVTEAGIYPLLLA